MTKKIIGTYLLVSFLSAVSFAQNAGQSVLNTSSEKSFGVDNLILGIKSYNDSTRLYQLKDRAQKNYEGEQEVFAGIKINDDWSVYGQIVQYAENYNDQSTKKNAWVVGDPSLTLVHPTLYDDGDLKIAGQLRQYFPVSTYFTSRGIYETAYYSFLTTKVGKKYDLFNVVTPRFFYEDHYYAADTNFYIEDRTTVSRYLASWTRAGIGQWTQIENHSQTPTGYCTELYPYADFFISKKVFVGPRVFFPVLAHASVYEGPSAVATDNIRGEIYFQASL